MKKIFFKLFVNIFTWNVGLEVTNYEAWWYAGWSGRSHISMAMVNKQRAWMALGIENPNSDNILLQYNFVNPKFLISPRDYNHSLGQ